MSFTKQDIEKLYQEEAQRHGAAGTSTIQDIRTRKLEVDALCRYLEDGLEVLEVGCGNGYVAEQIIDTFNLNLQSFDFSSDMIDVAKARQLSGHKGSVSFSQGDVLTFAPDSQFDVVFSERCIQNLETWEQQQAALSNITDWLKPGGRYVMLESFWSGLNNLNEARDELGLEPIPESWHNRYFVEEDVLAHMTSLGMNCLASDCFLSGFYFGSRVLLPALLPDGKQAKSGSRLNDYFCNLPPSGDFSPMKILHFEKS